MHPEDEEEEDDYSDDEYSHIRDTDSRNSALDIIYEDDDEMIGTEKSIRALSDDMLEEIRSGDLLLISKEDYEYLINERAVAHNTKRRSIEKERIALDSILEEFLSCYIIIGYDFQGRNVNITHADTDLRRDSLTTSLQKFVCQHMDKYMPPDHPV